MNLGSGNTYSENMDAASGGRGGSQNQAPSGFGSGDSGGGSPDPYAGYVQASKPRTGIQAIKDYFTGGGYDYGYQPTFAKTLGGIGNLLLGSINPVLGGLNFLRKNIGPEFDRFRQAPTLDRYFRPDAYIDKPYIIGTNPMDYQRFNPNQFGQEYKYRDGIASLNDIKNQVAELDYRIGPANRTIEKILESGFDPVTGEELTDQQKQQLQQKLNQTSNLGLDSFIV